MPEPTQAYAENASYQLDDQAKKSFAKIAALPPTSPYADLNDDAAFSTDLGLHVVAHESPAGTSGTGAPDEAPAGSPPVIKTQPRQLNPNAYKLVKPKGKPTAVDPSRFPTLPIKQPEPAPAKPTDRSFWWVRTDFIEVPAGGFGSHWSYAKHLPAFIGGPYSGDSAFWAAFGVKA